MNQYPGNAGLCGFLLGLSLVCGHLGTAAADPPSGAILLEGLSALAGGRSENESDAIPVLLGDVELDATLTLVARLGPRGATFPLSVELRRRARQRAVITRILAQRAKRLDETVDAKEIESLKRAMTGKVGGAEALSRLLARFGASEVDLHQWAENMLLAAGQIRYAREQAEEQGPQAMRKWLYEILALATARILR